MEPDGDCVVDDDEDMDDDDDDDGVKILPWFMCKMGRCAGDDEILCIAVDEFTP